MDLALWDVVAFLAFIALVVGDTLYQGRKEDTSEDYFLAGRNLTWWLIGFSLIASNISTEHFVGMAGSGFGVSGLAVASYEWIAAASLVIVGLWLLPRFLQLGIYTMPEFLEHRYGPAARLIMALYMLVAYVGVAMAAVLYSGALGLATVFDLELLTGIWLIGLLAGAYTIYGGLKAVVWSDLIQGGALLLGGTLVMFLGFREVGGVSEFMSTNADKLHVVLPADHPEIPWTALLLGIWIPNMFYWGFNQFITQRTLGAKSLRAGQRGILLAAAIKLIIPFIIIFPGIMAFQLYGDRIVDGDMAYAVLIQEILPPGLRGVLFAALFGAVMSSLDSMLNSASTIFTMDIYKRRIRPEADAQALVKVGRVATGVLVVAACLLAPLPARFEGVFNYIQMIWGFVSPGVVAVFFFGFLVKRAPPVAAVVGLVLSVPVYGGLLWALPDVAFLNNMAFTFLVVVASMGLVTVAKPLAQPHVFQGGGDIDVTPDPIARPLGYSILAVIAALYILFR
jgi:SSS family solute:Na+ symporter